MWERGRYKATPPCCCSKTATTAALSSSSMTAAARQEATAGQQASRHTSSKQATRSDRPVPEPGEKKRSAASASRRGRVRTMYPTCRPGSVCRLGCPGLSKQRAENLSLADARHGALRPNSKVPVKSISEKEAGQWARPGTDEVSGRRHGSQDTVVGCAAELRRMDERGWRLSGQVGPQQPRSSRADVPVPQLNDAKLSVIRFTSMDATSFPSCLAHRAQAGREYHPHLSACATAAAVLCGPQNGRASLPDIDGFPQRSWIERRECSAALTLGEQRPGLAVNGWVWLK